MMPDISTSPTGNGTSEACVGVVVPVYKIGPILSDTLQSLLKQARRGVNLRLVLVIDGCPYNKTTSEQIADYLYGSSAPIEICRKKNEGVSIARNFGLKYLLSRFPEVDYVLFFDADDLIPPSYIEKSIDAIQQAKVAGDRKVGWAYTDQFQFGAATQWVRYPRSILPSRFTVNNLSQPTSIVTRALIDSGIEFDEFLRAGIEDWEFWLNATRLGYKGVYVQNTYLKYRRLAGSRSSLNRANDAYTKHYLRTKHGQCYKQRYLLETEAKNAPRYAFWRPEAHTFQLKTSPEGDCLCELGVSDLVKAFTARQRYRNPDAYIDDPYFPDFIVIGNEQNQDCFGALLHAEQRLVASKQAIAAFIINWHDEHTKEEPWLGLLRVSRLMPKLLGTDTFARSMSDNTKTEKTLNRSILQHIGAAFKPQKSKCASNQPAQSVFLKTDSDDVLYIPLHDSASTIPEPGIRKQAANIETLLLSEQLSPRQMNARFATPKVSVVGNPRSTHWDISFEAIGVKHPYPWLPTPERSALLGVVGGDALIDRTSELLRLIRANNADLAMHWYIPRFLSKPGLKSHDCFDSITQLVDFEHELIRNRERFYNGVPLFEKAAQWHATVVNFLSACDFVLNVGCIETTLGISALRKTGLRAAFFYFPSALTEVNAPYSALTISEHLVAYLGVYHTILVDDKRFALRLNGLGVPKSKISLISNLRYDQLFSLE